MPAMLNFGCGDVQPAGWVNLDMYEFGQPHVVDILDGLPFEDDHFDGIFTNHVLHVFTWDELGLSVLPELCRVLRPGGVLRVIEMDPVKAFHAYEAGDAEALMIPDAMEPTLDGKFCLYLTWYSTRQSIPTGPYLRKMMTIAGFSETAAAEYGQTMSGLPEITAMDSRPAESYIVEGKK